MSYINTHTLIDGETGEILKEKTWRQYDGFNAKGYRFRNRALHIKFYFDGLPSNLSKDSFFLLFMIAELMNDNNLLMYKVTRKSKFSSIVYKPMSKEDIRERTRFKYGINKFDTCWKELTKHCLKRIEYYDTTVWAVNPTIFCKCREIPFWLCEEFLNYMTPKMSATAIKKLQDRIKNQYV